MSFQISQSTLACPKWWQVSFSSQPMAADLAGENPEIGRLHHQPGHRRERPPGGGRAQRAPQRRPLRLRPGARRPGPGRPARGRTCAGCVSAHVSGMSTQQMAPPPLPSHPDRRRRRPPVHLRELLHPARRPPDLRRGPRHHRRHRAHQFAGGRPVRPGATRHRVAL